MAWIGCWHQYTTRWRVQCRPPAVLAVAGLVLGLGLQQPRLGSAVTPSGPPPVGAVSVQQTPLPLVARPLEDLVPGSQATVEAGVGRIGVAVVVPSRGCVYVANGDASFPLASVVKVPLMLTVLDQRQRGGGEPDPDEQAQLAAMISVSDNDATTSLWTAVGGGEAVTRFVQGQALDGFTLDYGDEWGESVATPRAMALLLTGLLQPGLLGVPQASLALALLSEVVPEQRWGVTAGAPATAVMAVKNGWYPDESGWRLNSAGLVLPGDGQPGYALAILTDEQPDLQAGIATIELLATWIHSALHASEAPGACGRQGDG